MPMLMLMLTPMIMIKLVRALILMTTLIPILLLLPPVLHGPSVNGTVKGLATSRAERRGERHAAELHATETRADKRRA